MDSEETVMEKLDKALYPLWYKSAKDKASLSVKTLMKEYQPTDQEDYINFYALVEMTGNDVEQINIDSLDDSDIVDLYNSGHDYFHDYLRDLYEDHTPSNAYYCLGL